MLHISCALHIYFNIHHEKPCLCVNIHYFAYIKREIFLKKLTLRMFFFSYEEMLRSYFMINPFTAHPFLLYMTFAQNELLA